MRQVLILFIFLIPMLASGQQANSYIPRNTHSEKSRDLIKALKDRTALEISKLKSPRSQKVAQVLRNRLDYLEGEIKKRNYIQDDSLQRLVDGVWTRLLKTNSLNSNPGGILIQKSPLVTATSFGEGTVIVTVGMLSRIRNESQLAFVLAHELAHYELGHYVTTIAKGLENPVSRKVQEAMDRLKEGEADEKDIQIVTAWVYSVSSYTRAFELDADSVGFLFFRKSGYREDQAIQTLQMLDSAYVAKYYSGRRLFEPLDFAKFPFKSSWLRDPPQRKVVDTLQQLFMDSIRSHPHTPARVKNLTPMILANSGNVGFLNLELFNGAVNIAEFEAVEDALVEKRFDKCLFQALQLKTKYPDNVYVTTVVGRILVQLYAEKVNARGYKYVAGSSRVYNYDLRAVINFLNNLDLRDLGEIAYRYMNTQSNFNSTEEEHYFLLWKICDLTARKETMLKVKAEYQAKFPKGNYMKQMRKPEVSK